MIGRLSIISESKSQEIELLIEKMKKKNMLIL